MTVNLTLTLPDVVEGLFKSQPEQIIEAIERAVRKALSRHLEVKAVIAFNDEPTDPREAEALEAYRQELAENGRPDMSREAWIANYLETH